MNPDDFEFYKSYHLEKIKNAYIETEELDNFFDFLALEFFEILNFAKEANRKFFFAFLYEKEDFVDLVNNSNSWNIPVFDFENNISVYNRLNNAVDFIFHKGTNSQVNEIFNIIFGSGKWRFNEYSNNKFISIDVIDISSSKVEYGSKYLDYSLPPYIPFEFIEYSFPYFSKRYSFEDIVKLGGRNFLNDTLNEYIYDSFVLPYDSFVLNKSHLNKEFLNIIDSLGNDIKSIVLFRKSNLPQTNVLINSFFLNNFKVFVF